PGALPPALPVRTMRRWLVSALLGLAWVPFIAHAQDYKLPADLKAPAMIAEGRALYNRRCAGQCHGRDAQEGFQGPALVGKVYLDPPFVFATLITGRPGSAMPSWKGRLSHDELWKIIAFLSSLGDQAREKEGS
ncbi:MAG: c-type cytochrome, partial [Candidatus Methylomirabilis sp.]